MVSRVEQQIIDCIEKKENFVLDAGAGSGKTTTLVSTLNYLLSKKSKELQQYNQKIVCVTYTNVAKNEIIERTEHNNLIIVNTIHDFLWDCIKNFQKELKIKLLDIVSDKLSSTKNEQATKKSTTTKVYKELTEKIEKYTSAIDSLSEVQKIEYKNFTAYDKGVFSHDDLIIIAEKMFSSYPKLNKIISSLCPFIFVDEYQDTQQETIEILLSYLNGHNCVIGFFGDKMQQIYDFGIGEIPEKFNLVKIVKEENYRSSIEVVNLLNKIRDDIKQKCCKKEQGSILFYHKENIENLDTRQFVEQNLKLLWNINKPEDIKVLRLTHNLIAKENNYDELYKLITKHHNNNVITKNKDNRGASPYIDFLFDIEEIVNLYSNKKNQEFLGKITFEINSFSKKKKLKKLMEILIIIRNNRKIEKIINYVIKHRLLSESEKMVNYNFEKKKEFYENLMTLEYSQFMRLYRVQQEQTPFSTQHGTKGDEFDNVLVVVDDAFRSDFDFPAYFSNFKSQDEKQEKKIKQSKNLFYVACSRAKKNLAILCVSELSDNAKEQLKGWFGNIIE